MEIIEKQVEKVKEVPTDNYGYGYRGDIEIGEGSIKLNIPFTDKRLVFDIADLESFKEMLIIKD